MQFDNKISTGHIISMLAMSIAGLGAFFNVKNQADNTSAVVAALKADLATVQSQTHAISLTQASYSAEIRAVTSGIQRLELQLERIINGSSRP